MLVAERDKSGIKINICPPGMEVIKLTPESLRVLMSFVKHYFLKRRIKIRVVLPLADAMERKKNLLAYIIEPRTPLLDTYHRR